MHGLALSKDGKHLYTTTSQKWLWDATIAPDGSVSLLRNVGFITKEGNAGVAPCGVAVSPDGETAAVCLSANNSVALVDVKSGKLLRVIPVGNAPFSVVFSPVDGKQAYVSNWGGRAPGQRDKFSMSGGTPILVDKRGIAASGTVSVIDLVRYRQAVQIDVGLHPSGLAITQDGKTLYVANANSDTVSVVDTQTAKVIETINVRPDGKLPFGSMPNALLLSPDERSLYVANAGNNALAVVTLSTGNGAHALVRGFIPCGWFPNAIATDKQRLYVANLKGVGSRAGDPNNRHVSQFLGSVNRLTYPTESELKEYTTRVMADSRVPQALRALETAEAKEKPLPVPEHFGEPSSFSHVVYIIKENRTYDQILGDLPQGNGDTNLCTLGREITPNHHQLAKQFVLLDNFYCNGVISADGHRWATEGNVAAMFEKSLYNRAAFCWLGMDPLHYTSSGFIWDDVLSHGLSFRNYGEGYMGFFTPLAKTGIAPTPGNLLAQPQAFRFWSAPAPNQSTVPTLNTYTCMDYPGWNLDIPDVIRAQTFLSELRSYERKGVWPDLLIVYLPNDHTGGSPTPRAQVADNDLALGRIVEGISKSKFWPRTCIFVTEDDPSSGTDHVDGHRSVCLIISPYTKRKQVISNFYNQTSVLHTMELILGIPPMNQIDAMAPSMTECFTETADLTPYEAVPNLIPLDEMPKPLGKMTSKERYWERKRLTQRLDQPDAADDDTMNRLLWHSVKGVDAPYPAYLAGPHGRGLAALHLKHSSMDEDDD